MFIENIADYLQKLKKRDIKPEIFTVFEFPDDLTILEILNSIGYRLANLFGFVKINTTTKTVDTGEASVNVTGDVDNLNFDFTIPRGKDGAPGVAVTVGETTTGAAGSSANVTNSGTESHPVLNFTIPRGEPGPAGPAGERGPAGATGPAGPAGERGPAGDTGPAGPAGERGPAGDPGPAGPAGPKGEPGVSVTVGTTTTGEAGTQASVTNSGTDSDPILNFTIPRGEKGDKGDKGEGSATVTIGTTTTGTAGTQASVTNTGSDTAAILNFTIPQGETGPAGERGPAGDTGPAGPAGERGPAGDTGPAGPAGERGPAGDTGPAGPGVATGGTTGQVLVKKSDTNFDTEWINPPSGSTVSVNVGETTTGEPGTNASVTNSGDETNVVLNFTIPRGERGSAGDPGPAGPAGERGPAGDPGPAGSAGERGPAGDTGPAGPGVATGGTTGQVLAKKSDANFDTKWIDAPGGSAFTKTVLWKNKSPRTAFESKIIKTTEDGFNYPLLLIEFAESSKGYTKLSVVATDTSLIGINATLLSYYKGYRTIRTSDGTSWTVSEGFNTSTNTTDNDIVIPLNIIGYK